MPKRNDFIRAQPGPQLAFVTCKADIAIYGGSAGGGKSFGMLLDIAHHADREGWTGVYFRRLSTELTKAGGVWDEACKLFADSGGTARMNPHLDITWPSGARLQFCHLQHRQDVHSHQSSQYATIYFDELTQFDEYQFWYLVSRNRSTCGIRPYMRAATNPDPDSWVRTLIAWWIGPDGYPIAERSGVLRWFVRDGDTLVWADTKAELVAKYPNDRPMSLTFIAAKLEDNPALEHKDPLYRTKLRSLPVVEREQLLLGNWNIKPSAGLYFRRSFFETLDVTPSDIVASVRAWDKAATNPTKANPDPDWTAGIKLSKRRNGQYVIEDVERLRGSPATVERAIHNVAAIDGKACKVALWQDPGQAGKSEIDHYSRSVVNGYTLHIERASRDKVAYAGPVSSQAERGNIALMSGQWVGALIDELESFPEGKHDDQVDALSLAFIALGSARTYTAAVPFGSSTQEKNQWAI